MHTSHTWVEISKKALQSNCIQYKQIIGTGSRLAAVVKSNAYGHGQALVGEIFQHTPSVDLLCVALLSEALSLRAHGITKPIFVMSYIDAPLEAAAGKNIEFLLYSKSVAAPLNDAGKKTGHIFKVHVKVETGLHRFGVHTRELIAYLHELKNFSHLQVYGISTHFAESQNEDTTYTQQQFAQFQEIINQLPYEIPVKHVANSGAVGLIDAPWANMYRIGIGLYGYWPSASNGARIINKYDSASLKPALTWKTRITEIKTVDAGVCVGYSRTFTTQRPTILALLPVGYYDGYNPAYSNCAQVRMGTSLAPVVGRVAMNVTTIDITEVPGVSIGDEVILMGDYDGVRASDLAQHSLINNVRLVSTTINPLIERRLVE